MFRNLLIRRKLTLITMVTSCVALTVSFAAWLSYDSVASRNSLVFTLDLVTEMVGAKSGVVTITSEEDIRNTLDLLRGQDRIRRAAFFTPDGKATAIAGTDQAESIPYFRTGYLLDGSSLLVYRPIVQDGVEVGTVAIEADMSPMSTRLGRFSEIFALVLCIAMVVSFLISHRLQEVIAQPILHLTDVMRAVSDRKDYSLRARRFGRDEVGFLTDAFNDMLHRMQGRDAELEQHRDTLEEKVGQRTRELLGLNRQLRVSMDEARQAAVAKSQFLANMSHEIRTPMNGILGMNELLLSSPLNEQQRSYAEIVKSSAESLLDIINDILDFSKIEAGKLHLERIEFDPYRTVEDVVGLLSSPARKKGLDLVCWIAPNIPSRMRGDPTRLRQVLTNLIGNAVKFTEAGEISIRVSLESLDEETGEATLAFEVQDTGIGISRERSRELFQSFSQGDASMTRRYGGTGLGLAISRQLTEMMNGEIGVDSEEGVGSRFWFTARFEGVTERGHMFDLPAGAEPPRILVIDPSAAMREFLHHQLDSWGLEHVVVPDAARAVDVLEREGEEFALVLLDEEIAGQGDERLRALIGGAEATRPRVALVSWGVSDAANDRELGFDEVIRKPIRPSALFDVVLSACPQEGDEEHPEAPRRRPSTRRAGEVSGLRILLAEDNKINQLVASKILARGGYGCHVVSDGKQAVEAVRTGNFDVVLMDCQMPGVDGFEATRAIREEEAGRSGSSRIYILALTANAMKGDRERCLQAGMDDYLSKPVQPESLLAKLDEVGASRSVAEEAPAADVAPFDVQGLLSEYGGRPEELLAAIHDFEKTGADILGRTRACIGSEEVEELPRLMGELRRSLAVLSSDRLHVLAGEIEARTREGDLARIDECLDLLHGEWTRCRAYLPELIARLERVRL